MKASLTPKQTPGSAILGEHLDPAKMAPKEVSAHLGRSLLLALSDKGLLPSRSEYSDLRRAMAPRGAKLSPSFFGIAPRRDWDEANLALRRPTLYADIERVLGFGESMTRYLVAPVEVEPRLRARVLWMGTLANAIGGTYDLFVDSPGGEPDLLSRRSLARLLRDPSVRTEQLRNGRPAQRIVSKLLLSYFRLLHSLGPTERRRTIVRTLRTDILRLFEAENRTLAMRGYGTRDVQDVTDKSALLFVVMAQPAWLASTDSPVDKVAEHRRWLYLLGEFMGWVDDVRDLDGDLRNGRPNRLAIWLKTDDARSDAGYDGLVRSISQKAEDIAKEWDALATRASARVRLAFPVAVTSWLGGWKAVEGLPSLTMQGAWV